MSRWKNSQESLFGTMLNQSYPRSSRTEDMVRTRLDDIYDGYIEGLRDRNDSLRYAGNRGLFHASSSGSCLRKIYYDSVEQVEPTEKDADTLRLFRLGDIVHKDIQEAVSQYAQSSGSKVLIETEVIIPEYNVRGFLDLAILEDKWLYDIKTCNSYKWKRMFGRTPDKDPHGNYTLQLGTYGIWVEKVFGRLEGLSLYYYNKNTSQTKEVSFNRSIITDAGLYWQEASDRLKSGIPDVKLGIAPVQGWECNPKYCSFFAHCGGGIKPELLEKQ